MYGLYKTLQFIISKLKFKIFEEEEVKGDWVNLKELYEDLKNFNELSQLKF